MENITEKIPFTVSDRYRVFVDGKELTVYHDVLCDFVHIVTKDIAEVEVKIAGGFDTVALRPTRRGKTYTAEGDTVRFSLSRADYFSLEADGDLDRPLLLFADDPVEMSGFEGCHLIYFKPHSYNKVGILRPEPNTVIFIDEGAIMDGAVSADGAHHLRIMGNGILYHRDPRPQPTFEWRPNPININNSDYVELSGITVVGANNWNVRFWRCHHVLVENVKVIAQEVWSDGFDIVCCEDFVIRHTFVKNEDDCVCIKSSKNAEFGFETYDVRNVLVEDCVFWTGQRGNSVEIGYQVGSVVENVIFRNIDVIHRQTMPNRKFNRAVISVHNAGNGTVRNVTYENIHAEASDENFIHIAHMTEYHWGLGNGRIENIHFRNCMLAGDRLAPSHVTAWPTNIPRDHGKPCVTRNITFENVTVLGKKLESSKDAAACGFITDEFAENIKFI